MFPRLLLVLSFVFPLFPYFNSFLNMFSFLLLLLSLIFPLQVLLSYLSYF